MKSIFLSFVLGALVSTASLAQTQKKQAPNQRKSLGTTTQPTKPTPVPGASSAKPVKTSTVPVSAPTVTDTTKSHFDRFAERVNISYFGQVTSSKLGNYNSKYAAINQKEQTSVPNCKRNCDDAPQNLWSQLRFDYNFGAGKKFILAPRWVTMLSGEEAKNYRNQLAFLDAFVVGFQFPVWESADKKFSWFIRPTARIPTFFGNRTRDAEAGWLTYQPELINGFSYTFNDTWSIFWSFANRFWVYEDRYTNYRHRLGHFIQANQKVSEKGALVYGLEWQNTNNKALQSFNDKAPSYKNNWQNYFVGYYHDITPKFNLQPFVGTFAHDKNYSLESWYVSAYIGYAFK